jgi:hypothetical protein
MTRHRYRRLMNRLTGLALRAIGYGAGDSADSALDEVILAPSTLSGAQMWAEMSGELRIHSIAREA